MSVPGKQARKQSHALFKSIKCFSPAPPDNLKHSKGSVCPQLSGRSLCVSSCDYLPRWSIRWPVESFGISRLWNHQTQTLELCHLLASNSEIGICVAPCIEISFAVYIFGSMGNGTIYFQVGSQLKRASKITVWDMKGQIHTWPKGISKIGVEHFIAKQAKLCHLLSNPCKTRWKQEQNALHPRAFT